MGQDWHAAHPVARERFAEADEVLGFALSKICFEGPEAELVRTDHAQPAILATSVAAIESLVADGRLDLAAVQAAAGLSLGEYTALWAAGALSFADALRLVHRRGAAMQRASEARPSGMVSLLGADRETAEAVCEAARGDDVLVVANLNAPGQVVVSGDLAACERAPAAAKEVGLRRAIPLKVAGAFHSPVMEPARAELVEALADVEVKVPRFPVYSNVNAAPHETPDSIRVTLATQVVAPVLWEASMRRMVADGFGPFVEPPPGNVLGGLMRKIESAATVDSPLPTTDE